MLACAACRIFEAEPAIHPPTAVGLAQEKGNVPPEFRHAHAAGVGPRLLKGAKLRRVIRPESSRRDIQPQIDVPLRRPVALRHLGQLCPSSHRVERRPLEGGAVGVESGIGARVTIPICADHARVQGIDTCVRVTCGRRRSRAGSDDANGNRNARANYRVHDAGDSL